MLYCTLLSNNLSSKNSTSLGEQMQISWAHLVIKKLRGLVYCGSEACSADLPFFLSSQMHPITVLNVITARSVRAVYWRCLSGESCPCPLLSWKADIVSTEKWPAPAAVPPEMCNQATGQLWGLWGVYFQTAWDDIFTFSSFLVFHSHFHSLERIR